MLKHSVSSFILAMISITAFAQHSAQHQHQANQHHAQYSGLQKREIKALSTQQIEDLKAGKGMSLALPAELNGYPGPAHALELADKLKLTDEQRKRIQDLFNTMSTEAQAVGLEVIEAERKLDLLFKNKIVNAQNLKDATLNAAHAQAKLRETHLRYHLSTTEVMSKEQVEGYNRLRGY